MLKGLGQVFLGLAAGGLLMTANAAHAQDWPAKPIRIVVATGPATPPDILSRVIANELARTERWNVFAENRVGAIQTIAAAEAARNPADGYTVLAVSLPLAAAPALLSKAPIDLLKDFAPVIKLGTSYNALVTPPNHKANSLRELEALIKTSPGSQSYASGGFGTPAHLIGELFKQSIKGDVSHVPYNAPPAAINDLLAGTVGYSFFTTLPVVELVKTGKLKALAVTAPQRLPSLPDTPSVVEAGYPNLVIEDWSGFLVRSGTPPQIVEKLNRAVNKVLDEPAVKTAFANLGATPKGGSPAEFGSLMRSEVDRWGKVIKEAGIKVAD